MVAQRAHHVTQRGNRREAIFFKEGDQAIYLDLLREQTSPQTPAGLGGFYTSYADMTIVSEDGTVTPIALTATGEPQGGSTFTAVTATPWTDNIWDTPSSTHYFLADHLGTTSLELAEGGWPVYSGQFAPYGGELVNGVPLAQQQPDGSSSNYKFTGKERDTESGLDYFGARYYASSMGRFMSPDWSAAAVGVPYADLGDPQSLNLYSYVRNNPLSQVDADGHDLTVAPALQPLVDKLRAQSPSFNAELAAHEGPGSPNLTIGFGPTPNDPSGAASDGNTSGHFGYAGRSSLDEPDLNTYKGADVLINNSIKGDAGRVEDVLDHETGHVHTDRTNPTQSVKDSQHTKDTKGATPHDDRPEEKAANAFKAQIKAEQKQFKKEQKQREKELKKQGSN